MQRTLISIMLLLLVGVHSAWAVRVLEVVESSYELRLTDASLPLSSSGSVTFKACDDCSIEAIPVTPGTRYLLNRQEATLTEFNEHARQVRAQPDVVARTMLMVHYDRDTRRATRLVIKTFPAR